MMISISARDEQLALYDWYVFKGKRKQTVMHRQHVRDITPGMEYGIRQIRGGNYYLILPDMYHVDFVVPARKISSMVKTSTKKRKPPTIESRRTGRVRAKRVTKVDTGSARYKPSKRISSTEEKTKRDYKNYQWRKLYAPLFKYNKTRKIGFELTQRDRFGCRFINSNKGGIVVFEDGRIFRLPTKTYDKLMESSKILPVNKWLDHVLDADDLKILESQRQEVKAKEKDKQRKERQALKQQLADKKRAEARKLKILRAKEREEKRKRIQDLKERSPKAPASFSPVIRKNAAQNISELSRQEEQDSTLDQLNELADEAPDLDLEDLDINKNADTTMDANEVEVADADTEAVEKALDDEIEQATSERMSIMDEDEEDEEADFDEEDTEEDEEDLIDPDDDEDERTLEEVNEDEAQEEALDAAEADEEYEDIDEEIGPEAKEPDDEDTDVEESSDTDGGDSEKSDAEEEKETTQTFEEGDVIQFKKDETEQREFVILDVYPLKNHDNIMVYKVYDVGADSGEFHTVRTEPKKKNRIEKIATFVRKMPHKEFAKFYNAMESYTRNKDPITS